MKNRILIVSQYFWPENFKVNDLALALKEKGHYVEILTGKPNYPSGFYFDNYSFWNKNIEFWNEIKIHRSFLFRRGSGSGFRLFLNYISFAIFSSIRILFIKNKFDKIFVFQPSPITVGLPAIIAKIKFKSPIYFWVQDLWPASLSAAGGIKNIYFLKLFDLLTRFIYSYCDKILIQSKAFLPYLLNQKVDAKKIIYYPNTTEDFYKSIKPDLKLQIEIPKGFKVMFAGNIGESQSFNTILTAAKILKDEGVLVNWLILGEGRLKNFVSNKIVEYNLVHNFKLLGQFPSEQMPNFFSCTDVLLVSLKNDPIFSLTIPSKIQSYLASGKPIITSLNGEGSRIIEEANAGFTSKAEDADDLARIIKKAILLNDSELKKMGENARKYFIEEFEREKLINKLEQILFKE